MVEFGGSPAICFLSDVMWSGQSWAGLATVQVLRSEMFCFSFLFSFFSFFGGWVGHNLSPLISSSGNTTLLLSLLFPALFQSICKVFWGQVTALILMIGYRVNSVLTCLLSLGRYPLNCAFVPGKKCTAGTMYWYNLKSSRTSDCRQRLLQNTCICSLFPLLLI